jgi:hypothetical protein
MRGLFLAWGSVFVYACMEFFSIGEYIWGAVCSFLGVFFFFFYDKILSINLQEIS